jgi:hypothetical protein
MKWKQVDGYYWARECGRYTVDVVPMASSTTGQRCTAWRRVPRGMAVNLGCFDSLRVAFETCAADVTQEQSAA